MHKIMTKQYNKQTKSMKDASFEMGSVVYSFK